MKNLNHAFAMLVLVLIVWMTVTLPDYASHQWACATDSECAAEELATFGTINGSNPEWSK